MTDNLYRNFDDNVKKDYSITREILEQYATDKPQKVNGYTVTGRKLSADEYEITAYEDSTYTRTTKTVSCTVRGDHTELRTSETVTANFDVESEYNRLRAQAPENNDYMKGRGISSATCKKYDVVYDPEFYKGAAVLMNYSPVYGYKARAVSDTFKDGKKDIMKGCSHNWMPENLLNIDKKPVVITEGECDFLSLAEIGYDNIICLSGTGGRDKLLQFAQDHRAELEQKTFYYPIIINLDSDQSGEDAAKDLRDKLDEMELFNEVYVTTALNGEYKDINEYLQHDAKGLKKTLSETLHKSFELQSNAAFNSSFHLIIGKSSAPIKTGSPQLDVVLDGGFTDGLYTVGGNTGAGKTTYALQLADNIARANNNVLYIALEMSRNELRARSISRLTSEIAASSVGYALGDGCTSRQIVDTVKYGRLTDKDRDLISQAETLYNKFYASNMFVYEGVGDIDIYGITDLIHYCKQRSNIEGKGFIVFIDYLQMIAAPSDHSYTDKQQIDISVRGLKKASRDNCVPVVLLSSINRDSYDDANSLKSFKSSGDIEFTSSVCLILQAKQKSEYVKGHKLRSMTKTERESYDKQGATSAFMESMYELEPQYTVLEEECDMFGNKLARSVTLKCHKQREGKNQGAAYYKYCAMFNRFADDREAALKGGYIDVTQINDKTLDSVFRDRQKNNKVPFVYMRDDLQISETQLRQLVNNSDYEIKTDTAGNEVITPRAGQQSL